MYIVACMQHMCISCIYWKNESVCEVRSPEMIQTLSFVYDVSSQANAAEQVSFTLSTRNP